MSKYAYRYLLTLFAILIGWGFPYFAEAETVRVHHDEQGFKVQVDGRDIMIFGMNWDYIPIGENYNYSLWVQSDEFIVEVLHREMRMLRDMGINVIRQYDNIPPRWVTWIYRHYGIYTAINNLMGRYGIDINGAWVPHVDYGNRSHRQVILDSVKATVEHYKDTPGVLMWMLGNENNYGLHWTTFEIEALPDSGAEQQARAEHLYSLFGEAIRFIKSEDRSHPVSMANGDLQYLDLIEKHCKELDILGSNVYRGHSTRDFFYDVGSLNVPVMFTEFGADAYNAKTEGEDHVAQAEYLLHQWKEIYQNTYGQGRANNAIGGFIFQWSDGWWKSNQEEYLDVHDTTASWPNGGYPHDFVEGQNNMNEEWFGIVGVVEQRHPGPRRVRPRSAYYALREAFRLDPYAEETTARVIHEHFSQIYPENFSSRYDSGHALDRLELFNAVRVSNIRLRADFIGSEGNAHTERNNTFQVDHTESIFTDFVLQPTQNVFGRISLNFIGNVASNRLNPISYESRGRALTPKTEEEVEKDLQRVAIYQAEFNFKNRWFDFDGYYRTGHHHWGDEGDFFGLYHKAHYGPNLDMYNGQAPFGFLWTGRRKLEGIKLAIGPELYWGANPMLILKYGRSFGPFSFALMHQEDFTQAEQRNSRTSSAIPEPQSRKSTIYLGLDFGRVNLEVGGIFSGSRRVDQEFIWTRRASGRGYLDSGLEVLQDRIQWLDTLGAKLKLTVDISRIRFYFQGSYRGLVADGGPDQVATLTGWNMRESGRGNQINAVTGATISLGDLQVAPHVLYQKPLVGPLERVDDYYSSQTELFYRGITPRNIFDSPFAVLENRETLAFELLLTYDPTPATWFYRWNRLIREDARFAASLGFIYKIQPTSRDASIVILEEHGAVPLDEAPPAQNVWDLKFEFVSNLSHRISMSGGLFVGQNQSTGSDSRLVTRFGGDLRLTFESMLLTTKLLFNDWGPYDYHRDFNLTYPLQWYVDLSYGIKPAVFGRIDTRFGFHGQLRTLDRYSEGFIDDGDGQQNGSNQGFEYELGTYIQLSL